MYGAGGAILPEENSQVSRIALPAKILLHGWGAHAMSIACLLPCLLQPGFSCAPGSKDPYQGVACNVGHWCPGNSSINVPCQATPVTYCEAGLANKTFTKCTVGSMCRGGSDLPVGCTANTYAQMMVLCISCLLLTQSLAGSAARTDCKCIRGYTGPDGGACAECTAGTYNYTDGAATCQTCGAGSFNPLNAATQCTACETSKYTESLMGKPTKCFDCAANVWEHTESVAYVRVLLVRA
mmetsp:Transcript_77060/g.125086  ORF Transcript_77060/g.125086 Transcript_77060/m.125086 type:complete len:239 (-) Transcript_77060:1141-1857(-)